MPRIRVQYKLDKEDVPGLVVLAVRWVALSVAMGCFAWGAYTIYDQHTHQEEAETLFQEAESPARVAPDAPVLAKIKRRVAKLDIPRLGVAGYVEDGLDNKTLRRAIGHAEWSAHAGQDGNVVLAAHRDTFFSGLRGVKLGDIVYLQEAAAKKHRYRVTKVFVVNPEDTWVMQPVANRKMLTMITCYPFSFVGHAPQRLIVQAQLDDDIADTPHRAKAKKRGHRRNRTQI